MRQTYSDLYLLKEKQSYYIILYFKLFKISCWQMGKTEGLKDGGKDLRLQLISFGGCTVILK